MALFDITAQNAYADYPLMLATSRTTILPKPLLAGQSETSKTHVQLTSWPGDPSVYVNKLV